MVDLTTSEDRTPWPGEVDTDGFDDLSTEQNARATALYHARSVLERRGTSPLAPSASNPPAIGDLLRVAKWILNGGDER